MKVEIPSSLRTYTEGQATVEGRGATLNELTLDLDRRFPGMRFRMIDEQDHVRPHLKFFVNREQIRDLATPLVAADVVAIIQAFSGG